MTPLAPFAAVVLGCVYVWPATSTLTGPRCIARTSRGQRCRQTVTVAGQYVGTPWGEALHVLDESHSTVDGLISQRCTVHRRALSPAAVPYEGLILGGVVETFPNHPTPLETK